MTGSPLPPGRFTAGYSVGDRSASGPAASALAVPAPPSAQVNRLAVLAFALVLILGPLAVPVAMPMAAAGQRQIGRNGQSGAGLARAALFIGAVYLVIGAVVLFLVLSGGGR
ncbi:MAG: hypothetical protein U1D00_28915 [Mycobacterium sp.]|nr:hypothetical protein [Mycobacterium sp.]